MQSRLSVAAVKLNRTLFPAAGKQFPPSKLGFATSTGRTADPAEHAVEHEEVYPSEAIEDERRRHPPENEPTSKDNESYVPPKPPLRSAAKLESSGVGRRVDPMAQQKRRSSVKIDNVFCAGVDGSPWPEEEEETDRRTQREEQERDDREYFRHRKASPLSEIEVADTRKPVSRATDGSAESDSVGSGDMVWRPEQLDTAEEALRRAAEIFRMNAMRGDPDSPHGRVLRQLRGEYW